MQEDQSAKKPLLPKELTTVTKVSKIVALIMFLTLPIIGFFMGRNYQNYQNIENTNEQNIKVPKTTLPNYPTTKPPKNTENWNKYVNETYKFRLRYPQNWKLVDADYGDEMLNKSFDAFSIGGHAGILDIHPDNYVRKSGDDVMDPTTNVIIFKMDSKLTLLDAVKKYNFDVVEYPGKKYVETKINGYDAVRLDFNQTPEIKKYLDSGYQNNRPVGFKRSFVYFKRGNFVYLVESGNLYNKELESIFNDLLLTFQYVKIENN